MTNLKKSRHAEFFEKVFSDRANAIDFIKGVFPKPILNHLDLKKLYAPIQRPGGIV